MYAILGATGNTGKSAAEALLAAGKKVRVIVRDAAKAASWKSRGAEVAVASLDDAAALERALTGVEGAYLLLPPAPTSTSFLEHSRSSVDTIHRVLERVHVPRVVFLSSIGAQHPDGTGPIRGLHYAEKKLGALPGVHFLRAAYFLDNWGAVAAAVKNDSVLPSFIASAKSIPMVSTIDIGRTAAELLTAAKPNKITELAGSSEASPDEVAAAFAKLTGKTVKSLPLPLEAVVPTFTGFGISEDVAALYREMYAGIAKDHVVWEGTPHAKSRGTLSLLDALRPLLG